MAQSTIYKRTLAGSVGSGMKSVIGNNDRRYYVLEHKVSSRYHKAGESQRIIVDEIEIGRDPRCQVRFDEQFSTVSRRHAAIVKDGDNWKLIQLSKTNSTYLNGYKVENEWYLQTGDEIQLSTNGPKLGFIVPSGDKGLVKSIGMTARLNLFRKQALRPYKTAISILAACLLIGCGVGSYYIFKQHQEIQKQSALIEENERRHQEAMAVQDSMINQATVERENLTTEILTLRNQLGKVSQKQRNISIAMGNIDNSAMTACLPHVFFIYSASIDITLPDGESGTVDCFEKDSPFWTGTGFLLNNGDFVTARHIIEPWSFSFSDDDMLQLNLINNNGGRVKVHFIAISSSGKHLEFTTEQFIVDKSKDRERHNEDGIKLSIGSDDKDFAYVKTDMLGGLKFDKSASTSLKRGTKLVVLGFPLGYGANSPTSINPISSTATVGVGGLDRGVILTSETNFERGCSGGPALILDEQDNYMVVGIASAIDGRNTGFVVPISNIKN